MHTHLILLLAITWPAAVVLAQRPPSPDSVLLAQSVASIAARDSAGERKLRLTSQRYLIPRWSARDTGPHHVLLHETARLTCCSKGERDTDGDLSIEAWIDSIVGPPVWTASIGADEGSVWGQFYRTTAFGCCDTSNQYTYFNLLTGGPLFVASEPGDDKSRSFRILNVPGSSLQRAIAFHDTWTAIHPPEAFRDSSVLGVLQYGSPRGPVNRVAVRRRSPAGPDYRLHDIRFVVAGKPSLLDETDLWSANGKEAVSSLSGFAIELRLMAVDTDRPEPDAIITIPVVGDRLEFQHARCPQNLELRASAVRLQSRVGVANAR